jgi:hypothetical protein
MMALCALFSTSGILAICPATTLHHHFDASHEARCSSDAFV